MLLWVLLPSFPFHAEQMDFGSVSVCGRSVSADNLFHTDGHVCFSCVPVLRDESLNCCAVIELRHTSIVIESSPSVEQGRPPFRPSLGQIYVHESA